MKQGLAKRMSSPLQADSKPSKAIRFKKRSFLTLYALGVTALMTTFMPLSTAHAQDIGHSSSISSKSDGVVRKNTAYLPPELEKWREWVRQSKPDRACVGDASNACLWVSALEFKIVTTTKASALTRFSFNVRNDSQEVKWIRLPGDYARWPEGVSIQGASSIITERDQQPWVKVSPGLSKVEGQLELKEQTPLPLDDSFAFAKIIQDQAPRYIAVTGGSVLIDPQIGKIKDGGVAGSGEGVKPDGETSSVTSSESDKPGAIIYRRLDDGQIPTLTTRIRIVSERSKKAIRIANILPVGSEPFAITGNRARWDKNELILDVASGVSVIEIKSRLSPDLKNLASSPTSEDLQISGREYWFSNPDPRLRRLNVVGSPVDPKTLPSEVVWPNVPVFEKSEKAALQISSKPIDAEQKQWLGTSHAELWLDFDGDGSSLRQKIKVNAYESGVFSDVHWTIKQARINDEPMLVSLGKNQERRVAFQAGDFSAQIFARSPDSSIVTLPAAFAEKMKVENAVVDVNIPPGWRFVGAFGAGHSDQGWISSFSLWDWFLLIIIVWGAKRFWGKRWAALILASLLASKLFLGAPFEWFIPLLGFSAIVKALPEGNLRFFSWIVTLLLGVIVLTDLGDYTVTRAQKTLHTSLDDRAQPGAYGRHLNVEAQTAGGMSSGAPMAAPALPQEIAEAADVAVSSMPMEARGPEGNEEMLRKTDRASPAITRYKTMNQSAMIPPYAPGVAAGIIKRKDESSYVGQAAPQAGEGEPSWVWSRAQVNFNAPADSQTQVTLVFIKPWIVKALSLLSLIGSWALFLLIGQRLWKSRPEKGLSKKVVAEEASGNASKNDPV